MAIKYKPTIYDFNTTGPSLTEQEHLASCDINIMIDRAQRGHDIRMASPGIYGVDDTTATQLDLRIQKERYEKELERISKTQEFTDAELKHIPEDVQKKFKFRKKATKAVEATSNNDKNDEHDQPKKHVAQTTAEPENNQKPAKKQET